MLILHEGESYGGWVADQTYVRFSEEGLADRGVPQVAIDAARDGDRAAAVSLECRRRIYSAASAEAQMNMAAAVAVISSKDASARTDGENAILAGAEAAIGWVAEMRAAAAALAADAGADFMADAVWPEVPPEAWR